MRIGEIAKTAGIKVQTLRFYERRGLLGKPARLVSGYRSYPPETVGVLRFIKQSQEMGFTLDEIKQLLKLREQAAGNSAEVRALAQATLAKVDDKIKRLQHMRDELGHWLQVCDCGELNTRCPALEGFDYPVQKSG